MNIRRKATSRRRLKSRERRQEILERYNKKLSDKMMDNLPAGRKKTLSSQFRC